MYRSNKPNNIKWKKRALAAGRTRCFWCQGEMYFRGLETIEAAEARIGPLSKKEKRHRLVTIDHLIPLSRGGPDAPWNRRLACNLCNSRRGNAMLSHEDVKAIMQGEFRAPNENPRQSG